MEAFLIRYSIYVVFLIVFVIWIGIAGWLWRLERRLVELEQWARRHEGNRP